MSNFNFIIQKKNNLKRVYKGVLSFAIDHDIIKSNKHSSQGLNFTTQVLRNTTQVLNDPTQVLNDPTQVLNDPTQVLNGTTQELNDSTHELRDITQLLRDTTQELSNATHVLYVKLRYLNNQINSSLYSINQLINHGLYTCSIAS
jgi:uncharacterized phage infection (PIP) family protein YhgE